MRTKTILFDLDGTLTDSGDGIINSAAMVLEAYGLPVPDRETLRVFVGPPLHDTFRRFGIPDAQCDDAVALYRTRYNTIGKFENSAAPGAVEPGRSDCPAGSLWGQRRDAGAYGLGTDQRS